MNAALNHRGIRVLVCMPPGMPRDAMLNILDCESFDVVGLVSEPASVQRLSRTTGVDLIVIDPICDPGHELRRLAKTTVVELGDGRQPPTMDAPSVDRRLLDNPSPTQLDQLRARLQRWGRGSAADRPTRPLPQMT